MVYLETWPTQKEMVELEKSAPAYMYPNSIPIAAIVGEFIKPAECRHIAEICNNYSAYRHDGCSARTSEIGHIAELDEIRSMVLAMNKSFWNYDLDDDTVTWMQSYRKGDSYQLHMDGSPGRMRKLTAVVLLSDANDYDDGILTIYHQPIKKVIPRSQGTVVVFPPWILHDVSEVTQGFRQSLNMGFWGPNFR